MNIYAMADLHLALDNPDKTMEIFGESWKDYMKRIKENSAAVGEDDLYLLPGDLSWAMHLDRAAGDFAFIDSLPGQKLAIRGNHDYWWATLAKMERELAAQGIGSVKLLKTDAFVSEKAVIAGTRGWKRLEDDGVGEEDRKIHDREIERMKLCISSIENADPEHKLPHILMVHFPPCGRNGAPCDYADVIEQSGTVDICLYGHLHGRAHGQIFAGEKHGVKYFCVAADYLKFKPLRVL